MNLWVIFWRVDLNFFSDFGKFTRGSLWLEVTISHYKAIKIITAFFFDWCKCKMNYLFEERIKYVARARALMQRLRFLYPIKCTPWHHHREWIECDVWIMVFFLVRAFRISNFFFLYAKRMQSERNPNRNLFCSIPSVVLRRVCVCVCLQKHRIQFLIISFDIT